MPQDPPPLGNPTPAQGARAEFDAMLHQSLQAHMQRLLTTQVRLPAGDQADLRHYALVSAGQCTRWSAADMVATHTLEHERLFIQTPEADMAEIGPWLIELPRAVGPALLDALAQQASEEALTLIASPLRLAALGAHLRSFMYGTLEPDVDVLLRYFDPRIGFDAVEHWPAPAKQAFLRPLAWWAGWDARGQQRKLKGSASVHGTPLGERQRLPPQWSEAIGTLSEPHLMAVLLAEELDAQEDPAAEWLGQIHPLVQRQIVRDALTFAEQAGLAGWDDRSLLCRKALLEHARFYTHPALRHALAAPRPGRDASPRLREALARLPAQVARDWAEDREPMLVRLYDERARALLSTDPPPIAAS